MRKKSICEEKKSWNILQKIEKRKYFDNLGMRWSHNKKKKIKYYDGVGK